MEITAEAKKRLSSLIEEREAPLAPLAAKIGVSQSTLWNFIYGDTKNFSKLHRLATELKVSLDWILNGDQPVSAGKDGSAVPQHLSEPGVRQKFKSPESVIPILGKPLGILDAISIDPRRKIGEVECHPAQKNMDGSFAFYVVGEAMSPRYRPGELVYAVLTKPPAKGQDCIVELTNGESYLREFVAHKNEELSFKQLNPDKKTAWRQGEIRALHAVVGRG